MADCSVEQCDRAVVARGWCHNHYRKWQRNGTPTPEPPSLEARFFDRVSEQADGCWRWHSVDKNGYGNHFNPARGQHQLPHRWATSS